MGLDPKLDVPARRSIPAGADVILEAERLVETLEAGGRTNQGPDHAPFGVTD